MARYLLTTDTIAPAYFEDYVACQRRNLAGPPCHALVAWVPKFGTPNQMTMVQEIDGLVDLPPALATPPDTRLVGRVREVVDVIRPFAGDLDDRPLCELRTYRIAPEFWEEFLTLKSAILPLREAYSPNFGVFASISGTTYRLMHLWGYTCLEDRDAVRARLKSDAAWGVYTTRILPMIVEMQSILVTPIRPD